MKNYSILNYLEQFYKTTETTVHKDVKRFGNASGVEHLPKKLNLDTSRTVQFKFIQIVLYLVEHSRATFN